MASFADIIPKFNPYVQQLPVEAMVAVGMEKQKRYDEGLQKIQAKIDQVAGLSLLRPVDKDYLKSKLNELGNNLKGVAAGDFSNFQLVNSVGGMIGQISKDPFVLAAVKSTAMEKKNQEQAEAERLAGKPEDNAYFYSLQRKKYMESGLTDDDGNPVTLNAKYIPYKDVRAKLKDVAKDVGVDENIVQNLLNPDGTLNKVAVETLTKGKDANKIYDAFMNALDSSDYQQLAITGIYNYRNLPAEDLAKTIETSSNDFIATLQNKKVDIETEIANLKEKLVSAKKEDAELINKEIAKGQSLVSKINERIDSSKSELDKSKSAILSGDEDYLNGVRGRLHTEKFLTGLSKDFSEKISHTKYTDNPLWKAIMKENEFALDKWYKQQSISIDKQKVQLQLRGILAAERANEIAAAALVPYTTGVGTLPGDKINLVNQINDQYAQQNLTRNQSLIELARWDMKRLGWSDNDIKNWINTQSKAQGKTEEDLLVGFGTATFSNIKAGRITSPSELTSKISTLESLNNSIAGFQKLIQTADARAKAEGGSDVTSVTDIIRNTKPITVSALGRQYTLSPSDQVDLAKWTAYNREVFSTKAEDQERLQAKDRLEKKFGKGAAMALLTYGENQLAQQPSNFGQFLWNNVGGLINMAQGKPYAGEQTQFQKVLSAYSGESYAKYEKVQEKVYGEIFSGYFPKNEAITLTEKSRPGFDATLAALFIDRPEYAEVKSMLDDPKSQIVVSTAPSLSGFGGSEITLRVVGKDGVTTSPLVMNEQQYQAIMKKPVDQVNPNIALARAVVNASPDNSSNIAGLGNLPTARFGSNAFINVTPQTRGSILGGDFVRDATGADVYYPKLYYKPSGTNDTIPVDIGAPMTLGEVLSFPLMLDDNKLKKIISNK